MPAEHAFIGKFLEPDGKVNGKAYLDLSKPRVGVIVGKRGSGKSYTAGVILEECIKRYPEFAYVVIDIMGIYWSLKYPNLYAKELQKPGFEGEVSPEGFEDKIRVLVVEGDKEKYTEGTYDGTISLKPSAISYNVWLNVFRLRPDEPQAILLKLAMDKAREKKEDFTLEDIISALDELSEGKQFQKQTFSALKAKLKYAESWGIFSGKGFDLRDILKPGVITIIDVSESDKVIANLLVGFLAEKIYEERKKLIRAERWAEVSKEKADIKGIPPTWLIIEEAHNFLPRERKTKATGPLVTYVKEGRHPGCALLLITQEPSSLDVKVLKQIDFLIIHGLSHKNDFKAVSQITPCPLPENFEDVLLKLDRGQALVCVSGWENAQLVSIRPRASLHIARTEILEKKETEKTEILGIWKMLEKEHLKVKTLQERVRLLEREKEELERRVRLLETEREKLMKKLEEQHAEILRLQELLKERESRMRELEETISRLMSREEYMSGDARRVAGAVVKAVVSAVRSLSPEAIEVLKVISRKERVATDELRKDLPVKVRVSNALKELVEKGLVREEAVNKKGKKKIYVYNMKDVIKSVSIVPLTDQDVEILVRKIESIIFT